MAQLNRILFVGLGNLGISCIFRLKKRMVKIQTPTGSNLLHRKEELLEDNIYQFLIYSDTLPDSAPPLFPQRSFTGSDDSLFFVSKELCSAASERKIDFFKEALYRLTSLKEGAFKERTGHDISGYEPTVVFIFDLELYGKEQWNSLLPELAEIKEPAYRDKYHCHAIVRTGNDKKCLEQLKVLGQVIDNIFLAGEESSLILSVPQDHIDVISNFLFVGAQLEGEEFRTLFRKKRSLSFYSIGSAHLHYPKEELLAGAVVKILGDPAYGFTESRGREFFDFFVGRFRQIKPGEEEYPFSLGKFDPAPPRFEGDVAEELFPEIRESARNRAQVLLDDARTWLLQHADRIRQEFKKEAFVARLRELTNVKFFFKIYLEKWKETLATVDFFVHREVIQNATQWAEKLSEKFEERWADKLHEIAFELNKVSDSDGTVLAEHNGELAWHFAQKLVEQMKNVELPKLERGTVDTEHQPPPTPTRQEVENLIDRLPHPLFLVSRFAILLVVFYFFWDSTHNLIFGKTFLLPAVLTGTIILLAFVAVIYWTVYHRKVVQLRNTLDLYLKHKAEEMQKEIERLEDGIILSFFINAAQTARSRYSTRPGFFYHTIRPGKLDFDELAGKGVKGFSSAPNETEKYFLNRYFLYLQVQRVLKVFQSEEGKKYAGVLCEWIPAKGSGLYEEVVDELVSSFDSYGRLMVQRSFANRLENLPIWSVLLYKPGMEKEIQDFVGEALKSCGWILERTMDSSPRNRYKNLAGYLSSIGYQMSIRTFEDLSNRAKITLSIGDEKGGSLGIYSYSDAVFTDDQRKKVSAVLAGAEVIFVQVKGPEGIERIQWREDS